MRRTRPPGVPSSRTGPLSCQLHDLETIVSLGKRRGFVFPAAEIYGGFANTYDYGPLGVELKRNIRDAWWRRWCANATMSSGSMRR